MNDRKYGINIEYFSEPYYYDDNNKSLANINVQYKLCSDIDAVEALYQFIKLLESAGYRPNLNTIDKLKDYMECEGYIETR